MSFLVHDSPEGRESFSSDVAYDTGPAPDEAMSFVPAPPVFAVEVRSERDYGRTAKRAMESKRAEHFTADAEPAVPGRRVAVDDLLR